MKLLSCFLIVLLAASLQAQATRPAQQTEAFAGARGFAWNSAGGRNGTMIHVTNLNDSGPGSLRDAVSAENRTINFDVSGTIQLKSVLPVSSFITLSGESAPGDGITITGAEVSLSNSHDLVLRYLRIRQGLSEGEDRKSAINMNTTYNIMLDHLSVQWGRWDTIDMNLSHDVTIQNCIIGPGIDPQRFGCLCQCDNVTFFQNLWVNNQSRNPKAKGKIQYIGNVVYNWGVCGLVGGHSGADHQLDVIGNMFIAGPSSSPHAMGEFTSTDHVYQSGNMIDMNKDGTLNPRPVTPADFADNGGAPTFVDSPGVIAPPLPLVTDADSTRNPPDSHTALDAYQTVLNEAGDSQHRDKVDQDLIDDVRSLGKAGQIIHAPLGVALPTTRN
jgi:hypothetical protein